MNVSLLLYDDGCATVRRGETDKASEARSRITWGAALTLAVVASLLRYRNNCATRGDVGSRWGDRFNQPTFGTPAAVQVCPGGADWNCCAGGMDAPQAGTFGLVPSWLPRVLSPADQSKKRKLSRTGDG